MKVADVMTTEVAADPRARDAPRATATTLASSRGSTR
jgi:hypothetical protein